MNWNEALANIRRNIVVEVRLDESCSYGRPILFGPDHPCNTYNFNGLLGYKVRIGENNTIEVPIEMLRLIFEDSLLNNRIYNKQVFRIHYPHHSENATGHPCYVHVVGKIFENAGVAVKENSTNYRIL